MGGGLVGYLVLELGGIAVVDRHYGAVHMQLPHDGSRTRLELLSESGLGCLAQAEQADENVLLGILVSEEGLPATVAHVVPPDQLHLRAAMAIWSVGAWVRGCVGAWVRGCVGAWVQASELIT
jgi:hypothetical protein